MPLTANAPVLFTLIVAARGLEGVRFDLGIGGCLFLCFDLCSSEAKWSRVEPSEAE